MLGIILATTSSFGKYSDNPISRMLEIGFKFIGNPLGRKLTEDELMSLLDRYRPVGLLAGTEPITRKALKDARDYLRVISRVGVGWDNVDKAAAAEYGIKVYRTQGVLNQAVAELTIALIISALRLVSIQDKAIRDGKWNKLMGRLFKGKTLGIIGFGAIGQEVGRIAKAFHANVLYYDIADIDIDWAEKAGFKELLMRADIITLHVSGSERLLGPIELHEICKQGVIIINTARGGLIDEDALYSAIKSGRVAFACLDVFENEPYSGPLSKLKNVILTPHIGSYALEARVEMEEMAVKNLLEGLEIRT